MVTPKTEERGSLSRRAFISAAGLALAAATSGRADPGGPRLAAIDWAMLETAVAIGHMPVAACELIRFRAESPTPAIPADVVDLGLRGAPNFELLQLVRPDLILISPYYTRYESRLSRLAPVLNLPFYIPGEPPLPKALSALGDLATAVDDTSSAIKAHTRAKAELDAIADELSGFADRPLCLINIGDARHLRAFGFDSLFGSVISRLGLTNAWEGRTRFSFLAPVPIEQLATMPEARVVIVGEVPAHAQRSLARAKLWKALPPVSDGRLYQLPEVNAFGGLPSALRFARVLRDALIRQQTVQL
ncbi:amino acid ABC transporter substrate-binding protein [Roseivivax halodurans JCM 10272]|uniref:Amino acid ABC transporter substrate-binding protein n=1 Tax=Roseivivax halodurans JCM 10272 TaxID=1449350 RepID=X7EBH7_9RHOB|nr:iron-siderophore ABC transporter substrate-binding protein [Roseivivax halodurans]ETX13414.1 amino acid ABC transporter substrate-binding protein [Roseivivax halodurans JCM 10272]